MNETRPFDSVASAVKYYAMHRLNRLCIVDSMKMYTYADVWEMVKYLSFYYKSIGIEKGDRIVVECTQDARFLICGLACQLSGAIFVPMEHKSLPERCRELIASVDAEFLIYESDYDVATKKINISVMFEQISERKETGILREIASEDIAEILYTTGTTGRPKGIVITNMNNVAVAENILYGTEMSEKSVELIPLPLNHSHGLRSCYANFINGSTVILFDGVMNVKDIFDAVEKYHITAMDLSPSAAKVLLKLSKGSFKKYREQIEFIQIGTAMLDEDTKKELCLTFDKSRLYNFYGSTESGRSCILDFNKERGKIGCIGKPARHAHFIVTDENRNIISSSKDNMGLIAVSGIMNMKGYWQDENATNEIMSNGYIYTNDLGYIDLDGKVYMLGRADDVINYKGIKISPEEIESCALRWKEIKDCACIPVPDKMCGQVPCLFVVVQEDFNKKLFSEFLSTVLNTDKIPRKLKIIDKIPRTANGKIQRKKLLDFEH